MKRCRRNLLLKFTAGLSLLLCIAAVALWMRSNWRGDLLTTMGRHHKLSIRSEPGLIYVYVSRADPATVTGRHYATWVHAPDWSAWSRQGPRWWDRLGFGHYIGGNSSGRRVDLYVFPHYAPVVVFAVIPALLLIRFRRSRRRFGKGLCPTCGYDLRATPDHCPECGTIPNAVPAETHT